MVIENENERPALALREQKETSARFWTIVDRNDPFYCVMCNGMWGFDICENAIRFDAKPDAEEYIREQLPSSAQESATAAFIEINTTIHY